MNILFVCTGNTCRSPMAQVLFEECAQKRGVTAAAASCGLMAYPGAPATPETIQTARDLGVALREHRARPVSESLLSAADQVVGLTAEHQAELKRQFPAYAAKMTHCFAVPDPFGGDMDAYKKAALQIKEEVERLLDVLCREV